MFFDIIDIILNLFNLFPNGNKNESAERKQQNYVVLIVFVFFIISFVTLIANEEIFASDNLLLQILISLITGLLTSTVLIISIIRIRMVKTLYVSNFALLLLSTTVLMASLFLLINSHLKII